MNPLRYRGYVYDHDTGLYYLQSRYYDPKVSRYLNHDVLFDYNVGTRGYNLFAYCGNSPVFRLDPDGRASIGAEEDGDPTNDTVSEKEGGGTGVNYGNPNSGYYGATYGTGSMNGDISYISNKSTSIDAGGSNYFDDLLSLLSNGSQCFVAGTLIQAEDGTIPIENIQTGDMVWAWDEETGEVALKEVVETYVNETDKLVHVLVNGEEIITTPAHPFYSPVKGWTDAVHLRAGDILVLVNTPKRRKLSHEILGLIAIAAAISLVLFLVLSGIATGITEEYIFNHDIPMDEFDWIAMYQRIYTVAAVLSCITFSILFLAMMQSRIAYIQAITEGIGQLRGQPKKLDLPLKGNNELKHLAEAVNDMSEAQLALREKEQALAQEKEQLIRTLSHDIRTPLTSILAYSDYLIQQENLTPGEQKTYLRLIQKKSEQIRDLTAVLLDGSKRNLEYFDDGKFLMEQIAAEFQEELEEEFTVTVDFSQCPAFSGTFDVQELRRIFDNLSSNVRKYADPAKPVTLSVGLENGALLIRQTNAVLPEKPQSESYQIGLNSIRRIAQHYGGSVAVEERAAAFSITVMLSQI